MVRHPALPLTETTYLILLSLIKPAHGYIIMKEVDRLSNNNVKIAAGTMYGALDNLLKQGWIQTVASKDKRRKVYQVTQEGLKVIKAETERMHALLNLADEMMNEEELEDGRQNL
ncbi:MAG: helix-turn-helix transcriptional regulator [Aerococcus suis]|nr:helix-turn-helix transcriptional regulator [Aerococcus suis]MDY4647261.1 helix-turn-helix transcriptional regulator [Aerococcus suis]